MGVGVGVDVEEADGLGEVDGLGDGEGKEEGDGLGLTEGLGVALTAGLTEGLEDTEGLGDGVSVGVGVGVGVGDGELVSPKTSGDEGKKIDLKKSPEPIRINSKTPERIKVGLDGLFNITELYIN